MLTVLVIGYVWPEPASSAAGYRMLSLLDTFRQQDWRVIYASPAEKSIHRTDLPARGIEEVTIRLNCASFDDYIRQLQPDIVMFDRFMMEEQFAWRVEKHCPEALRVLDTEDLSCLRHARHQQFKQTGLVALEASDKLLFSEHAKREVAAILRSDLSLMISPAEIELLQRRFNVAPQLLHDCPFMLPELTDAQISLLPQREQRHHFVIIGNFRHAPNWDAVLWLKQQLWPLLHKRLPEAELHVYGAYPPPKATQLHNPAQGFLVKGWAEDAQEVIRSARVNLAPLRFGAGLKGKLVDALAAGTPSVTTSVGAEGMAGESSWPQPVADIPEHFVEQAVQLYQDASTWADCQQQGFNLYRQRFSFEQHAEALIQRLTAIKANLHAQRLSNFTGAMLRHHSMKSSQYMAQWIEAKNRREPPND
ncbi:glycosyltransferase [Marinobacterium stanieri]|nr:glycosyltransferase [Marinobacterium stanieri]